jgi:hypothetical protein
MKRHISIFVFICLISKDTCAQSRIQELHATQYKQQVIINYLISAGNACSGYQVQRSADTVNFKPIYDYSGICGELTKAQSITFTDEDPQKNTVNYYRILIPPSDHSKVVSVVYNDISEKGYLISENPISDHLKLISSATSKLKIYNQTGNVIREIFSNENGLYNEDVSSLEAGMYYFEIEPAIGQKIVGKFVKTRY